MQHFSERPKDNYVPKKEDHGHCHTTSKGLWNRDWSFTAIHRVKLIVTYRSVERAMLGIMRRDKIKNECIRTRTEVKDNIQYISLN